MRARRIAFILVASLTTGPVASAQPGDDDAGEVEIDPDPDTDPDTDTDAAAGADIEMAEAPAPVVKDPKAARKWQLAGKKLVQRGDYSTRRNKPDEARTHYENARIAYQKAVELGEDLALSLELASVEQKLGLLDVAALTYRTVIRTEGARPDLVKKATAAYDELMMEIGLVRLIVVPEGATISLAGTELGTAPLPESLLMMPGTYTMSFAADGYQPRDAEIKVEPGSESERTIELDPIPIVIDTPPPVQEPDAPLPVAAGPSRMPLYVGGSVAVGFVGVGIVTGLLASGKHGTFTDTSATPAEREDARTSGKNLALLTDVSLGVAVAAAGFTAYWYFAKYKPARAEQAREQSASARSKVDVIPWVQLDAGGVSVAGSF